MPYAVGVSIQEGKLEKYEKEEQQY